MMKKEFGTMVMFPVVGSTWNVVTPMSQCQQFWSVVTIQTKSPGGLKTAHMLLGVLGSLNNWVRAPVVALIWYMPQPAAKRNFPLAGDVMLSAPQAGPKGVPAIGVNAPVVASML